MSSTVIHLRDPLIPMRVDESQLTDDPNKVTCEICRKMIERQKRFREREGKGDKR